MQKSGAFSLLVFIPFLVSLGHDLYLFVTHTGMDAGMEMITEGQRPAGAFFASIGFILTNYMPETLTFLQNATDKTQWDIINAFLPNKASAVTFVFAIACILLRAIIGKIMNKTGYENAKTSKDALGRKKTGKFNYKRK